MIAALELPILRTAAGYRLRRAVPDDLGSLIALLTDDPIALARGETAVAAAVGEYSAAFAEVIADPSNEIVVAVDCDDQLAAMLQLTRIPGMARRGATRLLVEAVRVGAAHRAAGLGSAMLRWATGPAAEVTDSSLVQLTSDEQRVDAHRFYERLGFIGSHRGFTYDVR